MEVMIQDFKKCTPSVFAFTTCFNQIMTRFFYTNLLEGSTASLAKSVFANIAKQFNDYET